MKIHLLLTAVAGLALVGASPPSDPIPWEDEESLRDYPPCSATVTDRCIQTYERGVKASKKVAHKAAHEPAVGGPEHHDSGKYAASDYPPCSATVTDRCIQTSERSSATRMARKHSEHKRHMQLAMRAGERG